MKAPAHAVSVEIEVPFHDVDMLKVVWHGHYYKYFEIARTALLKKACIDASLMNQLACSFVVIDSQCRHKAPLQFADTATVASWVSKIDHRIEILYVVRRRSDGRLCAKGRTSLVLIDANGHFIRKVPREISDRIGAV